MGAMTIQQFSHIHRHAHAQAEAGLRACYVTSDQIAELTDAYADALRRLAEIRALTCAVLCEWADHHRDEERALIGRIEELCEKETER